MIEMEPPKGEGNIFVLDDKVEEMERKGWKVVKPKGTVKRKAKKEIEDGNA